MTNFLISSLISNPLFYPLKTLNISCSDSIVFRSIKFLQDFENVLRIKTNHYECSWIINSDSLIQ